ncbi:hypothetical protein BN77_p40045 [Rhizobium mesoamericanum STM3625]|uniref:Cytokinin glycosidase domain-containing protein n=1 Tax=Rhizobium mesoamericanum STM3625 TaxID=1211777 RepID=K0Q433_9HYPH|nr:hypothetical protein BN77_p40045 [Rhizobium mesoamericanum STM3625]
MKKRLDHDTSKYSEFLTRLLGAQCTWNFKAELRGFNSESAEVFSQYPCMNHWAGSNELEQIEMKEEQAELLYIYMPEANAKACLRAQSLDDIPDHMRFLDHDGQRKILAVDIPPYAAYSTIEAIVERYHSVGCGIVEDSDIESCLVIPATNWFYYDSDKFLFRRSGLGSFDVIAIAPVLLDANVDFEELSE